MRTSAESLQLFKKNSAAFLQRFVTMDETCIHHCMPEMKQMPKQRTGRGERASKMANSVPSTRKVVASVFWETKRILLINYLDKGKTITGKYYGNYFEEIE